MFVCFVDIGGIVDYHCLNFLYRSNWISWNPYVNIKTSVNLESAKYIIHTFVYVKQTVCHKAVRVINKFHRFL